MTSMEDHYAVCLPCRLRNEARKAAARAKPPTPKEPAPPPSIYDPNLYYARLRLVSESDGRAVVNVNYAALFDDRTRVCGTTDTDGLTELFCTTRQQRITRLTLTPQASAPACCGVAPDTTNIDRVYIGDGIPLAATVRTTATLPVTPVRVPKGADRGLTMGEEAMARTVFGDGVDYRSIRINHHGYGWLIGFQDSNTAMTPDGNMYMPHPIYRDDYSQGGDADRRLFMHEMVHVWQKQMGYPVKRKGLTVTIRGEPAYAYTLTPTSRLSDFNMEQQGNLMSDYYMICIYGHPSGAYNPQMHPVWLHQVMLPFVNPTDPQHLPNKNL